MGRRDRALHCLYQRYRGARWSQRSRLLGAEGWALVLVRAQPQEGLRVLAREESGCPASPGLHQAPAPVLMFAMIQEVLPLWGLRAESRAHSLHSTSSIEPIVDKNDKKS